MTEKHSTLERPPLEDTDFSALNVTPCGHWSGDDSCPNEPVWVGRRPCCGVHSVFCDECRRTMEQVYANRSERQRRMLRCSVCKTVPALDLEFLPA